MTQQNPYAPPKAEVADVVTTEAAPSLWNPNAAASWSLLFSPIFGAFLHMRNWEALGQPEKAATSKKWLIASITVLVLLSVVGFVAPESSKALDALGRIGGFGLLIAWYYSIGKSQQGYVLARFGKSYPRRGWAKPLLIALSVFVVYVVVVIMVAFAMGAGSNTV